MLIHTQLPAYQTSARVFCQEVQPQAPYVLLVPPQWQSTSISDVISDRSQAAAYCSASAR